jgi:fermentation-respiration switch protein FrsA (DUF1100 family)
MRSSVSIHATKVTFPNQVTSAAGSPFVHPDMDQTKKYPALSVVHPFGGVKEQVAGIYASKMADKGYVTLAFDASQGDSRETENPAGKMEDIHCTIDYLSTSPSWMRTASDFSASALVGRMSWRSYPPGCARRLSLPLVFRIFA